MKKIWKENTKLILIVIIAVVIASEATYAATTMYDSNIVGYDNTTSGLRSTTVQTALDELYGNVAEVILNIKNFIGNSTLTTTDQTLSGAINELDSEVATKYGTISSWVFFDDDSSHYGDVSAHGYKQYEINVVNAGSPVPPDVYTGYIVLNDRNSNLIVTITSKSGNTLTFRWYNPTNSTQRIQGIVAIFRYLT